jgi:diguanylate cyclase (GGDEF)-like protein
MRVLIADDDPMQRLYLTRCLSSWGYETLVAEDGEEAWRILQGDDAPPLVLLDWMMPGMDGTVLCQRIRSLKDRPYTYVVLLTARSDQQDLLSGLGAGADDYMTKPVNTPELQARLRSGQRIVDLQNKLRIAYEMQKYEATHDSLTGIWNRPAILELFSRECAKAAREKRSIGVLLSDVDHFKIINDQFGHVCGDIALREIARRMQASLRPYDFIGRYGGEEFLILVPSCDPHTVCEVAERIRLGVADQPIIARDNEFAVTLSIGVNTATPVSVEQRDELLQRADQALYLAKENGRNRIECDSGQSAAQ